MALISWGTGRFSCPESLLASWTSSRMISLHRSTHSSQMNTDGPAISLRTSCWLLPQKEQYNSLPSSPEVVVLLLIRQLCAPCQCDLSPSAPKMMFFTAFCKSRYRLKRNNDNAPGRPASVH